jgi:hypothetical protein
MRSARALAGAFMQGSEFVTEALCGAETWVLPHPDRLLQLLRLLRRSGLTSVAGLSR